MRRAAGSAATSPSGFLQRVSARAHDRVTCTSLNFISREHRTFSPPSLSLLLGAQVMGASPFACADSLTNLKLIYRRQKRGTCARVFFPIRAVSSLAARNSLPRGSSLRCDSARSGISTKASSCSRSSLRAVFLAARRRFRLHDGQSIGNDECVARRIRAY